MRHEPHLAHRAGRTHAREDLRALGRLEPEPPHAGIDLHPHDRLARRRGLDQLELFAAVNDRLDAVGERGGEVLAAIHPAEEHDRLAGQRLGEPEGVVQPRHAVGVRVGQRAGHRQHAVPVRVGLDHGYHAGSRGRLTKLCEIVPKCLQADERARRAHGYPSAP